MHQIEGQYKLIKIKDLPEHDEVQLSDFIMERFSNWLNGYTKAFNKMYGRRGSLFIDYTKRSLVETDASFAKLVHYIHANPVHHGYVKQIYDWHYSSYNAIISSGKTKLLRNEMLNWFGGKEQFIKYHEQPINLKLDNSEFS